MAEQIALTHHERWDGQGYPSGLAGEDIPLPGRIVTVADVFDALAHRRPYKEPWPVDEARREVLAGTGTKFDPRVIEAFSRLDCSALVQPPEWPALTEAGAVAAASLRSGHRGDAKAA